jgi:hypothetical protein
MYAKLNSASLVGNALTAATGAGGGGTVIPASGATTVSDVDNWQFRFRVHRDFYP